MRISVREFIAHPSKYIDKLTEGKIELTRYRKVVGVIITPEDAKKFRRRKTYENKQNTTRMDKTVS